MYLSAAALPAPATPPTPATPPAPSAPPPSLEPRAVRWETVDPDVLTTLSEEITSLSARVSAETHRLLRLIAEFDRLEGWKREGFGSCAEWLAYSTHMDKITAREKVRVARALVALPETSAAMASGELSFSQVRALTRVADPESEAELLGYARDMSAAALEKLTRSWRRPGPEDEAVAEARRHASRCLSVFPDTDGSYLIRGRLDPEVGALLMRAIEAASDALYRGSVPETTPEQRRADALRLLAEQALASGFAESEGGVSAERYLVVMHVDGSQEGAADVEADPTRPTGGATQPTARSTHPTLPSLEDGTRVSAETSRRIACDAGSMRVKSDHRGEPTLADTGRTRIVPPRMRRALQLRDGGCRFPGCGSRFTDAHHIRHWADGGPTALDNLVLLCRMHHRLLHEGGYRLEANLKRPGRPDFLSPRGVRIPETPPRMRLNTRGVGSRLVGGPSARWEEDVPLALYLRATGHPA